MGTTRITSSQSSPSVTFYLEADHVQTDTANRRWKIRAYLRMSKGSGSFYAGSGVQIGRYNGIEFGRRSGTPFLPSGTTSWYQGPFEFWVNANSNGYWSGTSTQMPLQMQLSYGNVNTTPTGTIFLPRIGTVPPPPSPRVPDQITATSMRYAFDSNGNGGLTIIRWEYQYSTSSTFASGNSSIRSSSGTSVVTGLTPVTTYYFRSRGVNAAGNGPWSAIRSGTTLAGTAPGSDNVLNGIAWDSKGRRLFVTGKLWPKMFEVTFVPVG